MTYEVNTFGLSKAARALLRAAIEPTDNSKGLLLKVNVLGGTIHIVAGRTQWTFASGEGSEYVSAFHQFVSDGWIAKSVVDGTTEGYRLTDIGWQIANAAQLSPE